MATMIIKDADVMCAEAKEMEVVRSSMVMDTKKLIKNV